MAHQMLGDHEGALRLADGAQAQGLQAAEGQPALERPRNSAPNRPPAPEIFREPLVPGHDRAQ